MFEPIHSDFFHDLMTRNFIGSIAHVLVLAAALACGACGPSPPSHAAVGPVAAAVAANAPVAPDALLLDGSLSTAELSLRADTNRVRRVIDSVFDHDGWRPIVRDRTVAILRELESAPPRSAMKSLYGKDARFQRLACGAELVSRPYQDCVQCTALRTQYGIAIVKIDYDQREWLHDPMMTHVQSAVVVVDSAAVLAIRQRHERMFGGPVSAADIENLLMNDEEVGSGCGYYPMESNCVYQATTLAKRRDAAGLQHMLGSIIPELQCAAAFGYHRLADSSGPLPDGVWTLIVRLQASRCDVRMCLGCDGGELMPIGKYRQYVSDLR